MSSATLYFVKFTEIVTGKHFYKFGYTSQTVQKRFDPYFANSKFVEDRVKYLEFDIIPVSTFIYYKPFIMKAEEKFKRTYPKNFYVETYLNKPPGYYDTGFTGITEVVLLEDATVEKIKDLFKRMNNASKELE